MLAELFESNGIHMKQMAREENSNKEGQDVLKREQLLYGFFGATEDMWFGGFWDSGRALEKDIHANDGNHNVCSIHSGGRGFLGREDDKNIIQKINTSCGPSIHILLLRLVPWGMPVKIK
jgi:hypothetical protein